VDGRSYDNACAAACAGVKVAGKGRCRSLPQLPTLPEFPTIPNFPDIEIPTGGKRDLLQLTARRPRLPPGGCICPAVYASVCGADGRQYGNSCEAGCAGVPVVKDNRCNIESLIPVLSEWPTPVDTTASTGNRKLQTTLAAPRDDCVCIALFKPVCGADGRQYGNACEAGCAGVRVVSDSVPPGGCGVFAIGGGGSFPRPQFPSLPEFPKFPDISFPTGKSKQP
jgi:hypothetical protein